MHMRAQAKASRDRPRGSLLAMDAEERWKELSILYSRAKIITAGGEDLLLCPALFSNDAR